MGNQYKILTGGLDKAERRVRRNKIRTDVWEEYRTIPYLDISGIQRILQRNRVEVKGCTIAGWIRDGKFGKVGVRKKGAKWVVTKKAFGVFMEMMSKLDDAMYPIKDIYKRPRRKRMNGFRSNRYDSLVARGIIPRM